jgi:hypothetical protein
MKEQELPPANNQLVKLLLVISNHSATPQMRWQTSVDNWSMPLLHV